MASIGEPNFWLMRPALAAFRAGALVLGSRCDFEVDFGGRALLGEVGRLGLFLRVGGQVPAELGCGPFRGVLLTPRVVRFTAETTPPLVCDEQTRRARRHQRAWRGGEACDVELGSQSADAVFDGKVASVAGRRGGPAAPADFPRDRRKCLR